MNGRFAVLVGVVLAALSASQIMMWRQVRALRAEQPALSAAPPADSTPRPPQPALHHAVVPVVEHQRDIDTRVNEIESRLVANPSFVPPQEMSNESLSAAAKRAADPDAALAYYDELLSRGLPAPERRLAIHGAMRVAVEAQQWDLVEDNAKRLEQMNPQDARDRADVLFFRALAHHQRGDLVTARKLYEQAAVVGHGFYQEANVYLVLGRMLMTTDPAQARAYFEQLIARFDGNGVAEDLVALARRDLAALRG